MPINEETVELVIGEAEDGCLGVQFTKQLGKFPPMEYDEMHFGHYDLDTLNQRKELFNNTIDRAIEEVSNV